MAKLKKGPKQKETSGLITSANADFPPECKGLYPPDHYVWLDDATNESPIMRLSDGAYATISRGIVAAEAPCGLRRYILRQREDGMFEETGEEITLDAFREEIGVQGGSLDPTGLSPRAILERYVFDRTAEAHTPHNHWNYTWPHLETELRDTPELRARVRAAIEESMTYYPNDFKLVGLQRRFLLYFADSSPGKQQMYVHVCDSPDGGSPFENSGSSGPLKPEFQGNYTPQKYMANKKPPNGQPLVYRGVAWVARFLLDGQSPAFHGCRVYVGEGDHPGFTDAPLPVGHFYCSDWCQRHDFTSYGKGINLQFADFTFDGWVMGACVPYAMNSGCYTPPPKLKVVSQDVRTLMEKHKNHRIPDLAEIMRELRDNRPTLDVALNDLVGDIEDATTATDTIVRAMLAEFKEGRIYRLIGMPVILSPSIMLMKPLSQYPELVDRLDEAGLAHIQLGDHRECPLMGGGKGFAAKTMEERFKMCPPNTSCIRTGDLHIHPTMGDVIPDIPALRTMVQAIVNARMDVEKRARDKINNSIIETERVEAGVGVFSPSPGDLQEALPFGEAGADAIPAPGLDADVIALADKMAAEAAAKFFPPFPGEEGYISPVSTESPGPSTDGVYPSYISMDPETGVLRIAKHSWCETHPEDAQLPEEYAALESRINHVLGDTEGGLVASCRACSANIHLASGAMLDSHACYYFGNKPDGCLAAAAGSHESCVRNMGTTDFVAYQESLGVRREFTPEAGFVPLQKFERSGSRTLDYVASNEDDNEDDNELLGKGWIGSGWMYEKLKAAGFKYNPDLIVVYAGFSGGDLCQSDKCETCAAAVEQYLPASLKHLLGSGLKPYHIINTVKHWYEIKDKPYITTTTTNVSTPAPESDYVWQSIEDVPELDSEYDDHDAPSSYDAPL